MYFEFLLRRAHSRRRVDRTYWSGVSLYSFTTCSNDVMVGTTGPIGSGLPQFGLPRRFAIETPRFHTSCSTPKGAELPTSHSTAARACEQVFPLAPAPAGPPARSVESRG